MLHLGFESELHQLRLQLAAIRTAVSAAENTLNGLEKEDPNAVPLGEKNPIGSAPNNLKFQRDASLFRGNGIHLSDSGIEAVRGLFSDGLTIEQVAAAIGISVSAAASRRRDWQRSLHATGRGGK